MQIGHSPRIAADLTGLQTCVQRSRATAAITLNQTKKHQRAQHRLPIGRHASLTASSGMPRKYDESLTGR
jgi:hypothetical protein